MMDKEKYISVKSGVTGYSFANIGAFTGFANGGFNAVYSLVLFGLFTGVLSNENMASSAVGVYAALYAVWCMIISFFSKELLCRFPKIRVLYVAFLLVVVGNVMMGLSHSVWDFVVFDYLSGLGATLVWMLIPLFMADFSGNIGMAKLNARYYLWINIGYLIAPLVALNVAAFFNDYKIAFFISGLFYALGFLFLSRLNVVQAHKKVNKKCETDTLRMLKKNAVAFFRTKGMFRAYLISFGYWAFFYMRLLYIPIIMIEQGFSAANLSFLLTVGIVPYIFIDLVIGSVVKKVGKEIILATGLILSIVLSVCAIFATGWWLFAVFLVWECAGALMEPVCDLLFFDNAKKKERAHYYGVFRTTAYLANIIVPILGAICIAITGVTTSVWSVLVMISVGALFVLLRKM